MKTTQLPLGTKLICGFLAVATLTTFVGAGGFFGLNRALSDANNIIQKTKERGRFVSSSVDLARSAQVSFKKQVQEWKDVLLRGQNPTDFTKYFDAFAKDEATTQDNLRALKAQLEQAGIDTGIVTKAAEDHLTLGVKYRDALKSYDPTQPNPASIVDKQVRGIDRATTDEIDGVVAQVHQFDDEATQSLEASFSARISIIERLTILGVLVGVVAAVGLGLVLSRSVTRQIRRLAADLGSSSAAVEAAAGEVSNASQTLASGASEQASSLEETSASLEEMSSMTKRNAQNATSANERAQEARQAADRGSAEMQAMAAAMQAIKTSSDDIAKIIKTIDEIAFQTNILALNAAVEAARAGEAGMGFAVVADEVRNLAQRSARASRETAEKIEGAIVKTAQGVEISEQVRGHLEEIVLKVHAVDTLIAEVAGASREQSQGIEQVNIAVRQMDTITQNTAAGAEESAGVAQELNAQAVTLRETVTALLRLTDGSKATVPAHQGSPAPAPFPSSRLRAAKALPKLSSSNGRGQAHASSKPDFFADDGQSPSSDQSGPDDRTKG